LAFVHEGSTCSVVSCGSRLPFNLVMFPEKVIE